MHFEFSLDWSDIDLWNTYLLDTHLDLLDTYIASGHFVFLQDILKTSSRYFIKTSSKYVFKTSSKHVFKTSSRYVFKTSSRRLQDISSRRLQDMSSKRLQDMSSRRLENVFSVTIFRSPRHLQDFLRDVFKTCSRRRLEDQQMFAGNMLVLTKWRIELIASILNFFYPIWLLHRFQV